MRHGLIEEHRQKTRNSNVELLRLFAMLLVVFNHFLWNINAIIEGSHGLERYALLNAVGLLQNFGGVGDDLFFGISAWFLCVENVSIKRNLKRVWLLEKQLLFYAIVLFSIMVVVWFEFGIGDFTLKTITANGLSALIPFISKRWWYPTCYILFLFFHPWLDKGLRVLGRASHRNLVIAMILVWAVVPYFDIDLDYSLMLFVYLYTIVAYVRWYLIDLFSDSRTTTRMIAMGLILGIVSNVIVQFVAPNSPVLAFWMNKPRCIPALLVSIGLLLKVTHARPFHSRVINALAKSTLAVYLMIGSMLASYAAMLCQHFGAIGWVRYGQEVCAALLFFCFGILLDFVRRALFKVTVDRHPGLWFEILWNRTKHGEWLVDCIRHCIVWITGCVAIGNGGQSQRLKEVSNDEGQQ